MDHVCYLLKPVIWEISSCEFIVTGRQLGTVSPRYLGNAPCAGIVSPGNVGNGSCVGNLSPGPLLNGSWVVSVNPTSFWKWLLTPVIIEIFYVWAWLLLVIWELVAVRALLLTASMVFVTAIAQGNSYMWVRCYSQSIWKWLMSELLQLPALP